MSALSSRMVFLFTLLITSSIFLSKRPLASPINEQLGDIVLEPRELDGIYRRAEKASLLPREDDDLLPTAADTQCKRTPPSGGQWASEQVPFPTVVSLKADMTTCGNVGNNTVFYSYGIGAGKATAFAETLSPRGVTFNDALDFSFIQKMTKFNLGAGSSPRTILFIQRWEEAMASILFGTVYLVLPNGYRAYSPPGTERNDWYNIEFPVVQRNQLAQVVQVVKGDLNGFPQSVGWLPNDPSYAELPAPNTDNIPVPPVPSAQAQATSTTAPSQTCTLQAISGGKAGILTHDCACNIGPTPKPSTSGDLITCPTQAA